MSLELEYDPAELLADEERHPAAEPSISCQPTVDTESVSEPPPKLIARKRVTSDEKYVAFVRAVIRGYGRRIASGDPEDVTVALDVAAELHQVIGVAVRAMRANSGCSWAEVGRALGMTRQAAQQRYGATP